MANAAGTIDAVGYVDMQPNANESNDGYVQDNGSSNRIAWRSVNGITTPATLRELNIKNTGPQYVGAVTDPVVVINEEEYKDYTYPGSPIHPMAIVPPEFYAVGTNVDLEKFHNIPWDPALVPHDVINYNSRLASHLWVKMFKNGVEILNSRVAGSPSASTTNCIYI